MAKTVDPKCYDLAKVWLANEGWTYSGNVTQLAQEIQQTIEDFITDMEDENAESH